MNKLRKEALDKIKIMNPITNRKEFISIAKLLSIANGRKYNLRKLSEELNELAAVCLKLSNKKGDNEPTRKEFIDELGDVKIRLSIVASSENVLRSEIDNRILYKANKYIEYASSGKYSKI